MTDAGLRLCVVLRDRMRHGLPDAVLHEAKRLLLNQLKASVSAITHPSWQILHDWAVPARTPAAPGPARVLWSGAAATPAQAAVVNGASFALQCFGDTHLPTQQSATAAVLAAVLARSEAGGHDGHDLLTALALGIEVALAWAAWGKAGAGMQAMALGAAAGCGVLAGLSVERLHAALAWAACLSAAGSQDGHTQALLTGLCARAGIDACDWAQRGLAPPGTLAVDAAPPDELGTPWRLFEIGYHTLPAPAAAHAAIDAALALWPRARTRQLARMRVRVAALGADTGADTSDLRLRLAAAWQHGQYTLAEQPAGVQAGAGLLALRDCIEVTADPALDPALVRTGGCELSVQYRDGTTDTAAVDDFLGAPSRPLTDPQLCELFRHAAQEQVPAARAGEILQAVWALHAHPDVNVLMGLLSNSLPNQRE